MLDTIDKSFHGDELIRKNAEFARMEISNVLLRKFSSQFKYCFYDFFARLFRAKNSSMIYFSGWMPWIMSDPELRAVGDLICIPL